MRFVMSKDRRHASRHRGFTLVELLVVIAIIAVLVGLAIPSVMAARTYFNRAAVKFEVNGLADAVEKYRAKYGDYPPDGSSWPIMEAHLRKAFPEILITELNLLNPLAYASTQVGVAADVRNDNDVSLKSLPPIHYRVMDPAEALVFFLGGFSSDKQRPFTGPGGPFAPAGANGQALQYNASRQNAFYEFPTNRLTLTTELVGGANVIVSTDEIDYGEPICQNQHDPSGSTPFRDLLPVFLCYSNNVQTGNPYVYFDQRTYQTPKPNGVYFNLHQTTSDPSIGAARPFLSQQVNTAIPAPSPQIYENNKTFQIISPGIDGRYGGMLASPPASLVMFTSKGEPCVLGNTGFVKSSGSFTAFTLPGHNNKRPIHDNATSFVESNTLGDNL